MKLPWFIGEGHTVEELVLDGGGLLGGCMERGNDLGDGGTVPLASLLRLSSKLRAGGPGAVFARAFEVLRLRNIGISDGGLSQIISTLVSNKSHRAWAAKLGALRPSAAGPSGQRAVHARQLADHGAGRASLQHEGREAFRCKGLLWREVQVLLE